MVRGTRTSTCPLTGSRSTARAKTGGGTGSAAVGAASGAIAAAGACVATGAVVNVAVTARSELIARSQVPVPVQAPPQPSKVEPAAGAAVSETFVPFT